jgi:hypothetical protein
MCFVLDPVLGSSVKTDLPKLKATSGTRHASNGKNVTVAFGEFSLTRRLNEFPVATKS